MIDADRLAFARLIAGVYELYGKDISEPVLGMWWEAMRGLELGAVRGALNRHAMNPDAGMFLPKPADVIRELGGTSQDASLLAWSRTVEAVRSIGSWESVKFDDPIINRVIVDLGGWIWLCAQTEREWPFVEKRFRDAYRAWMHRGLEGTDPVARLPGHFEAQNALRGYEPQAPRQIADAQRAVRIVVSNPALLPNHESRKSA